MNRGTRIFPLVILIAILAVVWWFFFRTESPPLVTCPDNTTNNPLPPENCQANWFTTANFDRTLAELPASACPNPLLPGAGQCTVRTYQDAHGQKITITVEGDAGAVQAYLQSAKPYFLVQQVAPGVSLPHDMNPPDLATILIESAKFSDPVDNPRQIFRDIRDQLIKDNGGDLQSVNLADVLTAAGSGELPLITMTPDQVLEAAIARAMSEFASANINTGLPQEEMNNMANSIPDEMKALMNEPGAAFLNDPDSVPHDEASYRDALMRDNTALAVTLNWDSAPKTDSKTSKDRWAVWYAIDPPVGAYQPVFYKWHCGVSSASSRIQSVDGMMTNYFEQRAPYYYYIGSRTADIQGLASPYGMVRYASGDYNTYVIGGPRGGSYYIYGGWIQGYGC